MNNHLIFKSVSYQNFLAAGNAGITICLNASPMTLIYGKNGAGKSTMYEALYFGLYGKSFKKSTIPDLINNINNKKMLVEVELTIAGIDYKIVRGRAPTVFEIYRDNKLIDQGSSSLDYQSYFEKVILGMSAPTFMQIAILGSLHYIPFMRISKTKDRMAIIEELLEIQLFSAMLQTTRTHLNSLKRELETLQNQQNILNNSIALTRTHIADFDKKLTIDKTKIEDNIKVLRQQIFDVETSIDTIEKEKSAIGIDTKNKKELEEQKTKWQRFKTLAEKELYDLIAREKFLTTNDICPTCTQEIQEKFKVQELEKTENRKTKVDNALHTKIAEGIKNTLSELDTIQRTQNQVIELNNKLIAQQAKTQSLHSEINRLAKSLSEESNNQQIQEKQKQLQIYQNDLDALIDARHAMQKDSDEYEFVSKLLNDDGIKKNIIKMYIPIINKLIAKYLEILEFPIKFTFDESFDETIIVSGRRQLGYSSFSAGESMRVDLALLFAFREIPIIRSGKSCNLLIFDEVADSAMDSAGWDAFLTIINNTDVGNVFVISPRGENLVDKFPSSLVFRKEGPFSICDKHE